MGSERLHPEQHFLRTPGLAALFHQIRYDVNNKGVRPENLNTYAYLRVFSQMGEEYARYSESKQARSPIDQEQILKLQEFGKDGFRTVIEVAKETAGITDEELLNLPREEQSAGTQEFTTLSPFIESLEGETSIQPTQQDKRSLTAYLRSLSDYVSLDPLFQQSES